MVPLSTIVLLTTAQVASTVPSRFLVRDGAAYVASPTYPVKPVTTNERFYWSPDGSRLAIVSESATETPSAQARLLAKGETPYGPMRLSVWSRNTGRLQDVFATTTPLSYVGAVEFIGSSLVFTSSSGVPNGRRFWIVRDGGNPQPLVLPGYAGHRSQAVLSPHRNSLVVAGEDGIWLVSLQGVRKLLVPEGQILRVRGVTAEGRAVISIVPSTNEPAFLVVDFITGSFSITNEPPEILKPQPVCPFILDGYALRGTKTPSAFEDPDGAKVDGGTGFVDQFEGGGLLDLVERTGSPRRRLRFLNETARLIQIAPDGLSFAFVSNGVLMVRYLVRCDVAATKRLIQGAGT